MPKLTTKDVIKPKRLQTIEGTVPQSQPLCRRAVISSRAVRIACRVVAQEEIPLYPVGEAVTVRCVLYDPATAAAMPPQCGKASPFRS